jgi:hypothetical protein
MKHKIDDYCARALLIGEPWVGKILAGRKTWEMRKRLTRIRGTVGLIRIGSGLVVGTADLVDCIDRLTDDTFAASVARHGIETDEHASRISEGYLWPWVLTNARRLSRPVPYGHKSQQIWVTLSDDVAASITAQGHALRSTSIRS